MPQRSVRRNLSSGCPVSPWSLKTNSIWSDPHPKKSSTWTELTSDHWAAICQKRVEQSGLKKLVQRLESELQEDRYSTYLKCFLPYCAYVPLVKGYSEQTAVSSCVDHLNILRLFKGELTDIFHCAVLKVNKLLMRSGCHQSGFQHPISIHHFSWEHQHAPCKANIGMGQYHSTIKHMSTLNKITQGLAWVFDIQALIWMVLQSKNKHLFCVEGQFSGNTVGQLNGDLSHLSCLQRCIEDITSMAPQHCGTLEDIHIFPDLITEFKLKAGLQSVWAAQCEETKLEALSRLTFLRH